MLMIAALGFGPGKALTYAEMPEWLTGMGVAVIEPADATTQDGTS